MCSGIERVDERYGATVGLADLSGWTTIHSGRKVSEWRMDGEGELTTAVTGAELFRDLSLTGISEVDVTLRWKRKPGFLILFAKPGATRLSNDIVKLETWENDLVLQALGSSGDFEILQNLESNTKSIQLRLVWNPRNGELSVLSSHGRLLGKMKGAPNASADHSGLYIQNKGTELSLVRIQVNYWNRPPDAERAPGRAYLFLTDSSSASGEIRAFHEQNQTIDVALPSGQLQQFSLDDVASIDLQNRAPAVRAAGEVQVGYFDGSQISGTVVDVNSSQFALQTAYVQQPLKSTVQGVIRLNFPSGSGPPDPDSFGQLKMKIDRSWFHGELAAADSKGNALGWRPVGSANASVFPPGFSAEIWRYRELKPDPTTARDRSLDRLFLHNGDTVPCQIHAIDDAGVHVKLPEAKLTCIDRKHVKAVEFGVQGEVLSDGFTSAGWIVDEQLEGSVERTDEIVTFSGPGSIGHHDILPADEIRFDIIWTEAPRASLYISFYRQGLGRDAAGQASVVIFRTNDDHAIVQGMPGRRGYVQASNPLAIRDGRNEIRLALGPSEISVCSGDDPILNVPVDQRNSAGRGLSFNVQWTGAPQAPAPQQGISIANFRVYRTGVDISSLPFDAERQSRVLTIPRFFKNNPPTEILLARNGDLLRGRLIRLDKNAVSFVSRLEQFSISRDRLAGVVWPAEQESTASPSSVDGHPVRIVVTTVRSFA